MIIALKRNKRLLPPPCTITESMAISIAVKNIDSPLAPKKQSALGLRSFRISSHASCQAGCQIKRGAYTMSQENFLLRHSTKIATLTTAAEIPPMTYAVWIFPFRTSNGARQAKRVFTIVEAVDEPSIFFRYQVINSH